MRQLHIILLWIRNVFNLKSPIFSSLEYTNYIIEEKSYLVISWHMKNAFHLKVKNAEFQSILKSGSAYIALADNNETVVVIIYGSWRYQKYVVKLKRIVIDETIEFHVDMLANFDAKLTLPNITTNFSKLKMNSFKASIIDKNQIKKIINISYPN